MRRRIFRIGLLIGSMLLAWGLVAGIAVIVVGIIHKGDSVLAAPGSMMPLRDAIDGYAPLPKIRNSISAADFPRQSLAIIHDRSTGSNQDRGRVLTSSRSMLSAVKCLKQHFGLT